MTRVVAFRTGILILGVLAILALRPAIAHAETEEYIWFDFCSCWIYTP